MKRILITGASGFFGSNLAIYFREKYTVFGTYFKNPIKIKNCHMFKMDIQSSMDIQSIISTVKPNIIIHCIALSNVDECERNQNKARALNLVATENLCRLAGPLGIQVVYISTDQVYDSPQSSDMSNHEFSLLKPLNFYAKTKLKAEGKVKELCLHFQILRLALAYGLSGGVNNCFTDELDDNFRKRKAVNLYANQVRTPILVDDACVAVERVIEDSPPNEVYNIGGSEIISRSNFGRIYAATFGFDEKLVVPVSYSLSSDRAPRALNVSLDSSKFINRFKYTPLAPEAGIKKLCLQKMMII